MIRVSIVEDRSELRESISNFLDGAFGFSCVGAYENAENALVHLRRDEPDVVLMDINLPGMSGIECVSQVRLMLPKTHVLMLTVYEDSESIFNALAAGAIGYLLKRMDPAKLLEAIHEVIDGGSPMSASIARKVVQSFQRATPREGGHERLSSREKEVLELLARGRAYKQIGNELGISIDTIRTYIRRIYEKLQVRTRTEAVASYVSRSGPLFIQSRRIDSKNAP